VRHSNKVQTQPKGGEDRKMTADSSLNPPKTRIIQKGFLEDKREFARDTSVHFIELCDACRRGDLEAVQTYF
jgi:hypothetical protein